MTRPYRTPEQEREELERAGWVIVEFNAWQVEAWNPTATIRTIISFGSPPSTPTPAPTPRQPEPMPTTTAKQLTLL